MSKEWIPWHGGPCPVAAGTVIDVKFSDGTDAYRVVVGVYGPYYDTGGASFAIIDTSDLHWMHTSHYDNIIAYRICDDGEEAKRTARMEEFRRIADEAIKTDKPVKAPVKEANAA